MRITVQGGQLYMTLCLWYPVKSVLYVQWTGHGQLTSYKVPEKPAMFIWSGCTMHNAKVMYS